MNVWLLLCLGLMAGTAAGMFGIGGGLIIVPFLVAILKMDQVDAIGTSLATIIIPANILGAFEYYRNGHANLKAAVLIAMGILVGSYFGARLMIGLPPAIGKKIYGVFLVAFGIRYLLLK